MNEQAIFINEYEITVPLLRKMDRSSYKTHPVSFLMFAIPAIVYGFCTVCGIASAIIRQSVLPLLVPAVAVYYLILQIRGNASKIYKQITEYSGETRWFKTFVFAENQLTVKNNNASAVFSYGQILHIDETDDAFHLWIKTGYFVIFKHCFSLGNADEFGEFIRGKCLSLHTKQHRFTVSIKRLLIIIALMSLLLVMALPGAVRDIRLTDPAYVADSRWKGSQQNIATAKTPSGAVVFGLSEKGNILVSLLEKEGLAYYYSDGNHYDIISLIRFDTPVTYGDAEFGVSVYAKEGYASAAFEFQGENYILYYRITPR